MVDIVTNMPELYIPGVQQLADHLEIREPICIWRDWRLTFADYRGFMYCRPGCKRYWPVKHHIVRIGREYNTNNQIATCVAHELCHASDCENIHNLNHWEFFYEYGADLRARRCLGRIMTDAALARYNENPWEKRAIACEKFAYEFKLTKSF